MDRDPEVIRLTDEIMREEVLDAQTKQLHAEIRDHAKAKHRDASRDRVLDELGVNSKPAFYRPSRLALSMGLGGTGLARGAGSIDNATAFWLVASVVAGVLVVSVVLWAQHRAKQRQAPEA